METEICSVYDTKAGTYFPPFFVRNIALAQRWFRGQIGNPEHDFHKFAEDYVLMHLGTFDDEKGTFHPNEAPVSIDQGLAVKSALIREAANVTNLRAV